MAAKKLTFEVEKTPKPKLSLRLKNYFKEHPNVRRGLIALGFIVSAIGLGIATGGIGTALALGVAIAVKAAAVVAIHAFLVSVAASVGGAGALAGIVTGSLVVGAAAYVGNILFRRSTRTPKPAATPASSAAPEPTENNLNADSSSVKTLTVNRKKASVVFLSDKDRKNARKHHNKAERLSAVFNSEKDEDTNAPTLPEVPEKRLSTSSSKNDVRAVGWDSVTVTNVPSTIFSQSSTTTAPQSSVVSTPGNK